MSPLVGWIGWILYVAMSFLAAFLLDRAKRRHISNTQEIVGDMLAMQHESWEDLRDLHTKIATASTLKEVRDHAQLRFRQRMQERGIAPAPVLVRDPKEKSDADQS